MVKWLDKAIGLVLSFGAIAIILIAFYQVLGRYLLRSDISWTEESMRYIYVVIVMLGIHFTSKDKDFARITIFSDFVTGKSKVMGAILEIFQNLVLIIFYGLMFYYGVKLTMQSTNTYTPVMRIPYGVMYAAIPAGSFLGVINLLLRIISIIKNVAKGE